MKELKWRDILIRTALVLATMAIVVWCMPRDNRSYFHVEQGKPWKYAEFTAPYDFPIYKSEAVIQEERDSAMRKYEPYYNYQQDVARKMILKFETDYPDGISGLPRNFTTIIANLLADMYHKGILEQKDYTELRSDTAALIRVVSGKQAVSVSIADLYSPKTAYERLFMDSNLSAHRTILQKCNLNNYIAANLSYDRERSEASKNDLMGGIALASGVVVKGQKIVDRGEIVTEKTYRIIESFKHENELRNEDVKQNQLSLFGHILYVLILMIGFTVYLSLYRLDYFGKARSLTMTYALIVIFALLTALFIRNTFIHVYIVPYAMVPIIIRIFMDSRTAFMTHVTMILICAVMLQHPFEFIVIETVAGLAAITSLRELTERSQLFKTAVIVTLACLAVLQSTLTLKKSNISLIGDVFLADGDVVTGTGGTDTHITIAAGSRVKLAGLTNTDNISGFAGIECLGDAHIILEGENSVKGDAHCAGISVPGGKTLTISGTGSLTATGGTYAAGIGGDKDQPCGHIRIMGGTITATGGTAAAGIGGGFNGSFDGVTISNGITRVTAKKGDTGGYQVPLGWGDCDQGNGSVTIGSQTLTYQQQRQLDDALPPFSGFTIEMSGWDGHSNTTITITPKN